MSQQTTLLLDPDMDDKLVPKFSPVLADIVMSRGFPVDDPAAGSAEGYVGEDNHFYGVLHLGKYNWNIKITSYPHLILKRPKS